MLEGHLGVKIDCANSITLEKKDDGTMKIAKAEKV